MRLPPFAESEPLFGQFLGKNINPFQMKNPDGMPGLADMPAIVRTVVPDAARRKAI